MILNSASMRTEAFILAIAATIAGESHAFGRVAGDDIVYFGAGYWRGRLHFVDGSLIGITLINPDRTPSEIAEVEKGIAVLHHCKWGSMESFGVEEADC